MEFHKEKIGFMRLENKGGFVVCMDFCEPSVHDVHKPTRHRGSGKKINSGASETQDPGKFGIAEGATFTVWADIRGGRYRTGSFWFIYDPKSPVTASFVVAGATTLESILALSELM